MKEMKLLKVRIAATVFTVLCSVLCAIQLSSGAAVNCLKAEALNSSKDEVSLGLLISTTATIKTNSNKVSIIDDDNFFDKPWSPENPVPTKYRDKKVQLFGLAPDKKPKELIKHLENKRGTKQKATEISAPLNKSETLKKEVKASTPAPLAKPLQIISHVPETEESESDESNTSHSNFIILAETMTKPVNSSSSSVESDSTQPSRELLDSLLNLPPSLLDQAAKSVESGQITPEALASLLKLRPDLLGESASKINVNQITPDAIRSLLKLRMTFMQSGGDSNMFDQFAKGSPEDLVKLMQVMSPGASSGKAKSKKKSKKPGQIETATTSSSLSALLGGVAGETEVKPTAKPAILPNLLTLVRPQLFELIGLDMGKVNKPDRVKSQRFGAWKAPQYRHPPPRYRPAYVLPRRRPSNPILRAVSRGLESVSNHFQKKAKFVSNFGR